MLLFGHVLLRAALLFTTTTVELPFYQFPIFNFESNEPFLQSSNNISCLSTLCKCLKATKNILIKCRGAIKEDELTKIISTITTTYFDVSVLWLDLINKQDFPDPFPQLKSLLAIKLKVPRLKLSHTNIKFITRDTFNGMTEIEVLDLSYNFLSTLEGSIFEGLYMLMALNLEFNKILNFDISILSSNHELTTLDISSNSLESVTIDDTQINPNFKSISMANTTLNNDKLEAIYISSHINRLYLDHNELTIVPIKVLARLKTLQDIRLNDNPLACDCRNGQLFKWLKNVLEPNKQNKSTSIEIVGNEVVSSIKAIKCLTIKSNNLQATKAVTDITLQEIHQWCQTRCPVRPPCVCTDVASSLSIKCVSSTFEMLDKTALSGHNITSLDLSDVMFEYNRLPTPFLPNASINILIITRGYIKELQANAFYGIRLKVNTIAMEENALIVINEKAFYNMSALMMLNLANNLIVRLPLNVFSQKNVPNLQILDLSHNNIVDLRNLNLTPSLTDLYLQFNKIRYVNITTFKNLQKLEVLLLSGNNIACNCDTFSFSIHINEMIQKFSSENYRGNLTRNDMKVLTCQPESPNSKTLYVLSLVSTPAYMTQCFNETTQSLSIGNLTASNQSTLLEGSIGSVKNNDFKRLLPLVVSAITFVLALILIGCAILYHYHRKHRDLVKQSRPPLSNQDRLSHLEILDSTISDGLTKEDTTLQKSLKNDNEESNKVIEPIVTVSSPAYDITNALMGISFIPRTLQEYADKYVEPQKVYFDYTKYVNDPGIYLDTYKK